MTVGKPAWGASAAKDDTKAVPRNVSAGKDASGAASPRVDLDQYFQTDDCGGLGDCAPCVIGTALADEAGDALAKAAALKPGKEMQRQLRIWAAKEIVTDPSRYVGATPSPQAFADALTISGTSFCCTSLLALAQTLKIELRVWAWVNVASSTQPPSMAWRLYSLAPAAKSKPRSTIWMKLKDEHYQWLKPVGKTQRPQEWEKTMTKLQPGLQSVPDFSRKRERELSPNRNATVEHTATRQKTDAELKGGGKSCKSVVSASSLGSAGVAKLLGLRAGSKRSGRSASDKKSGRASALPSKAPSARCSARSQASSRKREANVIGILGLGPDLAPSTIAQVQDDNVEDSMPRQRGAHLKCKCGWAPEPSLKGNFQWQQARVHWRVCQGTKPPSVSPEAHKSFQREAASRNRQVGYTQSRQNIFATWRSNLDPKMRAFACDPEINAPFANASGHNVYVCKKCGRTIGLNTCRRQPCPTRPSVENGGISVFDWKVRVHGHSSSPEKRRKAVESLKRKQNDYTNKRYADNKVVIWRRRWYLLACKELGCRPLTMAAWRSEDKPTTPR